MWNSLLKGFGTLLAFFYSVIPSYGVAIILLTVAVRLVLYPLTAKQARSMAAMQRVQPELKRLQAKYKHDRQKLNEEMMAFYREHKINPLAGCLPLVAQLPIFFALFRVLRKPESYIPVKSSLFHAFCGPHATVSACTHAKGFPRGLDFLWMDLSKTAQRVDGGFVHVIPYLLLVALVVVTGYLQSKQMTQTSGAQASGQQQMIGRIMPIFFGLISFSLPAGLVLYFLVSNVWQIGQQSIVYRSMEPPGTPPTPRSAPSKEPPAAPKRGLAARPTPPPAVPRPPAERGDDGQGPMEAVAGNGSPNVRSNRRKKRKRRR